MRDWMTAMVIVVLAGLLVPQTALGQGGGVTTLANYGTWMVLEDENANTRNAATAEDEKILTVSCYTDRDLNVVIISVRKHLYEREFEDVLWIVDDGPMHSAEWTYVKGGTEGTRIAIFEQKNSRIYRKLLRQMKAGGEITFGLSDGEVTETVGFSLIGFTKAYQHACN